MILGGSQLLLSIRSESCTLQSMHTTVKEEGFFFFILSKNGPAGFVFFYSGQLLLDFSEITEEEWE